MQYRLQYIEYAVSSDGNRLSLFMLKLTCQTYKTIDVSIRSFDDKLKLAIDILDTSHPAKFLSLCPRWKNEYLVIALGCIGNIHSWSVFNALTSGDTKKEGIFKIMISKQQSFL